MKRPVDAVLATAIGLHETGQLQDAEKLYRAVLRQNPRHAGALYLLGLIALQTKRFHSAIDLLGRSIRCNPDFLPAYTNLGTALAALNRPTEALAQFDAAITRDPTFIEAYYNRGVLLKDLGRHPAAIESFDKALTLRPGDVESLNNRGLVLNTVKRHADALADFDKAIALQPGFAAAHCNRGVTLTLLKRPAEALASFDRALALQRDLAEAWCNRGDALHELSRLEDAVASFDKAIALRADFAEAHFGRSLSLLMLGRYAEGFREHEWRKRRSSVPAGRSFRQPPWLGERDIAGRTLFIPSELYLGDMVQFCRYALLAAARGAKVVLAVQRPLRSLLGSLGPDIVLIEHDETPPGFDAYCPVLSLPLAFGTTLETVPAPIPYLHAEADRIAEWNRKIGERGLKIGICWQGSADRLDLDRSFPVTAFAPLSRLPHVRLISLQTGSGLEQLADLPEGLNVEHFDDTSDSGLRPFVVLAAMMANLDLVITTDTVVAHLAGAMGRPAWVVLKQIPDWRWGQQADTTPWYPTLRLFRQKKSGDWTRVFDAIHNALQAL
jgi:tetratricopeptide (TPR) repeat protein